MDQPTNSVRLQRAGRQFVVLVICLLPFIVPFSATRNIDLQAYLLMLAGLIACATEISELKKHKIRWSFLLASGFIFFCLLSTLARPHHAYNLFGAPYVRLGILTFIACYGCARVLRHFAQEKLFRYIYFEICIIALLSVPYNILKFHSLSRLNGLFAQADILACVLGVGFMLGLSLGKIDKCPKLWLTASQIFLASALLLTQTRAVLVLTALLSLVWCWREVNRGAAWKVLLIYLFAGALLFTGQQVWHSRLANTGYAIDSVRYRIELQRQAVTAVVRKPLLGYGPGNLADALDCRKLHDQALQTTCDQRYFFNSSHNIYLDRILAIGIIGGLAYLAFVIICLLEGWRGNQTNRIFAYAALLVAGYYLTNVTSASLELLFWILLLSGISHASASP